MIEYHGQNEFGKHWALIIEPELFPPRGHLEVAIVAGKEGITFGGQLIRWEHIDVARKDHNECRYYCGPGCHQDPY